MNTKKVKKLILENRELVEELILTDYQLKVVEFVESVEEATSSDIVKWRECSIQSAHAILLKLESVGWLTRREAPAPSGGVEFVYKVKKD